MAQRTFTSAAAVSEGTHCNDATDYHRLTLWHFRYELAFAPIHAANASINFLKKDRVLSLVIMPFASNVWSWPAFVDGF